MKNLLFIEDDESIIAPLSLYINKHGYQQTICKNGTEAFRIFSNTSYDLVLLDINLPGKSGITICKEIRDISEVPIIVLSARNSEEDKLTLFALGVDDYVSKPFSQGELMARIAAVIKRGEIQKKPKNNTVLLFGNLEIHPKTFCIYKNKKEIQLTKTEFLILVYCVEHAKDITPREAIMKDVMGYEHYLYDRTIDTHMKNLRRKLAESITIQTVRGVGYRILPA